KNVWPIRIIASHISVINCYKACDKKNSKYVVPRRYAKKYGIKNERFCRHKRRCEREEYERKEIGEGYERLLLDYEFASVYRIYEPPLLPAYLLFHELFEALRYNRICLRPIGIHGFVTELYDPVGKRAIISPCDGTAQKHFIKPF